MTSAVAASPQATSPIQVVVGTAASARRAQLEQSRFVDVRNLITLVYKKPDGTPLMAFSDTLVQDRNTVIGAVVAYEVASGWLANDLGQDGAQPAANTTPQPTGVPAMQTPPPGLQMQPPPMAQPPMAAPPGAMPPPGAQAAMPGSNGATPPPGMQSQASPAQAAAVPMGAPAQQPEPAAVPGRKRRQAAGSAVAPPPAAPPATLGAGMAPPPGMQMQAPMAQQPPPGMGAPPGVYGSPAQAPPPGVPVQQTMAPAAAVPAAVQVPNGLEQKLDKIGAGIEFLSNQIDALKKANESLEARAVAAEAASIQALACLHHIYGQFPALVPGLAGIATLDDFRFKYLAPFTGLQR